MIEIGIAVHLITSTLVRRLPYHQIEKILDFRYQCVSYYIKANLLTRSTTNLPGFQVLC